MVCTFEIRIDVVFSVGPHTLTTFYFGALKDKMTHGKKAS